MNSNTLSCTISKNKKSNPNKIKPQIEFEADIIGLLFANHLELEVSPKRKEHMKAQWTEIQNHNQNFDDEHKITIENELSYVQKIFAENVMTLSECINNKLIPEVPYSLLNMDGAHLSTDKIDEADNDFNDSNCIEQYCNFFTENNIFNNERKLNADEIQ